MFEVEDCRCSSEKFACPLRASFQSRLVVSFMSLVVVRNWCVCYYRDGKSEGGVAPRELFQLGFPLG